MRTLADICIGFGARWGLKPTHLRPKPITDRNNRAMLCNSPARRAGSDALKGYFDTQLTLLNQKNDMKNHRYPRGN